jgi:hypothetical protein
MTPLMLICRYSQTPNRPLPPASFYDTSHTHTRHFDSPFRSVAITSQGQDVSLDYATEYGEAYSLHVTETPVTGISTVTFYSVCVVTQCHGSQYMGKDGRCKNYPVGPVSPVGSTKIADCVVCGVGLVPIHKTSTECFTSNAIDSSIATATAWRIRTPALLTKEGWKWDVNEIRFYSSADCSAAALVDTSI